MGENISSFNLVGGDNNPTLKENKPISKAS